MMVRIHNLSNFHLNWPKIRFNLGSKYIQKWREDLVNCFRILSKSITENNLILELKAHYTAGIVEIEYGSDLNRAEFHFDEFMILLKELNPKIISKNADWIQPYLKNIENYKQ